MDPGLSLPGFIWPRPVRNLHSLVCAAAKLAWSCWHSQIIFL